MGSLRVVWMISIVCGFACYLNGSLALHSVVAHSAKQLHWPIAVDNVQDIRPEVQVDTKNAKDENKAAFPIKDIVYQKDINTKPVEETPKKWMSAPFKFLDAKVLPTEPGPQAFAMAFIITIRIILALSFLLPAVVFALIWNSARNAQQRFPVPRQHI